MREVRDVTIDGLEVRNDSDGSPTAIRGYGLLTYDANNPGTEYRLTERVVERIAPDVELRFDSDMLVTWNHETSALLGRQSSGTARFSQDSRGGIYDVDLPDTGAGRDVKELVRRRDVRGSSFEFTIDGDDGDRIEKAGDGYIRWLQRMTIYQMGPVSRPAYGGTSADLRSADAIKARIEAFEHEVTEEISRRALTAERASRLRELRLKQLS